MYIEKEFYSIKEDTPVEPTSHSLWRRSFWNLVICSPVKWWFRLTIANVKLPLIRNVVTPEENRNHNSEDILKKIVFIINMILNRIMVIMLQLKIRFIISLLIYIIFNAYLGPKRKRSLFEGGNLWQV